MFGDRLTTTKKPIQSPIDLNAGALSMHQTITLSFFVLGALFVATLGGGLALYAFPSGYARWSIARALGVFFGGASSVTALVFAWNVSRISLGLWKDYRQRVADWHNASLDSVEALYGVETTTSYDRWQLMPNEFRDIWMIIAIVHQQYHNENIRSYTRRELESPLFASSAGRQVRVGQLNGTNPEKVGTMLAQLGLIEGRTNRVAGEWKPQTLEEAYDIAVRNWSKVI